MTAKCSGVGSKQQVNACPPPAVPDFIADQHLPLSIRIGWLIVGVCIGVAILPLEWLS